MADEPTTTTPAITTTTPAAPAQAPAPPMTGSGTFDWKAAGVDDGGLVLVGDRQWKNPGDLLTSYRNLEKLSGVPPDRLIKMPSEKDGPDAWKPIFQRLGMPETADKYVVPVPEGDKGEFANQAKQWFHQANLTQSQATKLAEQWNGFLAAQTKSQQEALDTKNLAEVTELKKSWGADYDANSQLVDQAAEKFGMDQEILNALKQAAGPKKAMEFLHEIGKKLGVEDSSVPGIESKGTATTMTPEMAKAEMARLKNDKTFAQLFTSPDPQQRMDAQNTMRRLTQMAYPGVTPVGGTAHAKAT